MQSEREKSLENSRRLQENVKAAWKKVEEYKRELEQKNYGQRGQVCVAWIIVVILGTQLVGFYTECLLIQWNLYIYSGHP